MRQTDHDYGRVTTQWPISFTAHETFEDSGTCHPEDKLLSATRATQLFNRHAARPQRLRAARQMLNLFA